MTLRLYLNIMSISAVVSWCLWGLVVYSISPREIAGWPPFIFYLVLFGSLIYSFALLGLLVRVKIFRKKLIFRQVNISLRQSVWFSAIIVFSLFLKAQNSFNWLNMTLFLAVIIVVEFLCLSHKTTGNKNR